MKQISEFVFIDDILDSIEIPNKLLPNPYYDFPFLIIDNFIDNSSCDSILDFAKNSKESISAELRSSDGTSAKNENTRKTQMFDLPPILEETYQNAFLKHKKKIENYFAKVIISSTKIQTLGYFEGFFYKCHSDDSSFLIDKNQNLVGFKLVAPNRKITTVLFANDDFDGGQLEFNFLKNSIGESIVLRPKKGLLIAFPSNSIFSHEVKRVINGFRLSLVQWHDAI